VVHPYNPPHVMPLIELVPSPATDPAVVARTEKYWKGLGREPVVMGKEATGFVANRLAFVLLREAIHLVNEGVVSVPDLDRVVESSMGPRWAVAGPFKSYHMGGGAGGLEGFMKNIGGTVQACWDDAGRENVGDGWEKEVFRQTKEAYGDVKSSDFKERDSTTKEVLSATRKTENGVPQALSSHKL
jgi:3-hydroxyacyl-CoA dehydrogenase